MHVSLRTVLLPALWSAAITGMGAVATPAFAKDVTVTISNFAFTPANTEVSSGDTVTFVNGDDTIHSVIADDGSFHSDGLDTNDKVSFTFTKAGTIGYHCGLHPFMKGQIVVK
jgi:plastocyanin